MSRSASASDLIDDLSRAAIYANKQYELHDLHIVLKVEYHGLRIQITRPLSLILRSEQSRSEQNIIIGWSEILESRSAFLRIVYSIDMAIENYKSETAT